MREGLRSVLERVGPFAPLLWWASLALVIVLTLTPGLGPPGRFGLDKIAHFAAYGWLSFLTALTLRRGVVAWALAVLLCAAVGTEFLQTLVTSRSAMLSDAISNLLGIACGTTIGHLLLRLAGEKASPPAE